MGNKKKLVTLKAEYIRENKDSIYLDCNGEPKWFPKAQVSFDPTTERLTLSLWLYEKVFNGVAR